MAKIRRYNKTFDTSLQDDDGNQIWDDLGIEMWCIKQGEEYNELEGRSLSFHFENCRKIIWPELDAHRWHNLCRDEILSHKVCVLMGCGSSGKTFSASWIRLLDYWCFPQTTCVLVSSTDIRGLKKRVWGEIVDLWERGVERFPKLAGHLLDSALAITTDNLEDCEPGQRKARDMRKGIFGVPCFLPDEMVDTPSGKVPIKDIKVGDVVVNAAGVGTVKETHCRTTSTIVEIYFSDGRKVKCTPEHPFFTERGWVSAIDLETCERVYSAHEAMQILRKSSTSRLPKSEALQCYLQNQIARKEMQVLQCVIQAIQEEAKQPICWEVLQHCLRVEVGSITSGAIRQKSEMSALWKNNSFSPSKPKILQRDLPLKTETDAMRYVWEEVCFHSRKPKKAAHNLLRKILQDEINFKSKREEKNFYKQPGNGCMEFISRFDLALPSSHGKKNSGQQKSLVSTGHRLSGDKVGRGNRRWCSQHSEQGSVRYEEGFRTVGARVDSVKILKPSSGGQSEDGGSCYTVYNLEVENHPSYSVNGFLVHNCVQGGSFVGLSKFIGIKQKRMRLVADEAQMMGSSFLSAFANLNKNEDFRAIVLGNPNDPLDPLGKAAEPKEGWTDDYLEPTKTTCWNTRFMNGRCVNLVGLDSPNFDFPADKPTKYKYLISQEKIEDTLSFFPKDSIEYYSQCVGTMKIGTMAKRVLTRAECNRFQAQEQAIWLNDERTSVYFVDAAYGGDRCVGGSAEFGKDVEGKQILSFNIPKVIPITVSKKVGKDDFGAEDQIALFVRQDCEEEGIPGSHMGHDSTGHGALGTALAQHWSSDTHPIDAGGAPTKRPVSEDIKIQDVDTGLMRLKRCDEHFDRLVSEFNFMIRLAVQSGQIRGLPDDCMEEFCARRWDRVKDDKYWVEPKDKPHTDPRKAGFKQRMGRSPDMADWAAGILEMARRKGFVIAKVGADPVAKSGNDWFAKEAKKLEERRLSRQLQAA